jgi:hypothetical protein
MDITANLVFKTRVPEAKKRGLISRITGVSPVSSFKEDTGETPVIREISLRRR